MSNHEHCLKTFKKVSLVGRGGPQGLKGPKGVRHTARGSVSISVNHEIKGVHHNAVSIRGRVCARQVSYHTSARHVGLMLGSCWTLCSDTATCGRGAYMFKGCACYLRALRQGFNWCHLPLEMQEKESLRKTGAQRLHLLPQGWP